MSSNVSFYDKELINITQEGLSYSYMENYTASGPVRRIGTEEGIYKAILRIHTIHFTIHI